MNLERKKILSLLPAETFIGRSIELDQILNHAESPDENHGMLVLSAIGNGTSELLKQSFDFLFHEQGDVIPVYFALKSEHKTAIQAAKEFLQTFLLQVVAFRRNDASLISSSPEICEIAEKAIPEDAAWVDRLVDSCEIQSKLEDERSFVRNCLSAPLRADSHGVRSVVMIDNLHFAANLAGEFSFIEEFKEILSRASIRYVLAGKRRYVSNISQMGNTKLQHLKTIRLEELSDADSAILVDHFSKAFGVKTNDETRDLMIRQFHGNPLFFNAIFSAAKGKGETLDSYQKLEQIYNDELFGGTFSKIFDTIFDEICPNENVQRQLIGLLYDSLTSETGKAETNVWRRRMSVSDLEFSKIIRALNVYEIISLNKTIIEVREASGILGDYIRLRFRLEILAQPRALVMAEILNESLKKAPITMATHFRNASALGLRELLSVFNCQQLPIELFYYEKFKAELKGLSDIDILAKLQNNSEIKLPQIVYTANCVAFYPQIEQISDDERCSVALGFDYASYSDENEVVWLVAEVDSKLEASKELTEFWCDRLEIAAIMCGFSRSKVWLITPEGFSPEASEVLFERNAYGSCRKQVELIVSILNAENIVKPRLKSNEYEMVVPMGDDTELIAAHAIEEIAKRHNFPAKSINQMKTALVEACINATEHSFSPDRKIYQKFIVEEDRIIINVSNRGVKLATSKSREAQPTSARRGWGLKLIKSLMDEVTFEQVDDGTSISMTKYLSNSAVNV